MNAQSVHYSRDSDEWETPQAVFDTLNAEFNFTLDAAAVGRNSKCGMCFIPPMVDSLSVSWGEWSNGGPVWLNPPYSRIGKFIEKAYTESTKNGVTVVTLIPSRTDTRYWHDYVMRASEVRLIKGRLKFKSGSGAPTTASAPFPSAIIVFKPGGAPAPTFSSFIQPEGSR